MRSRTRSLATLGLALCLGAALGLPATASAERDGRGWRNERQHDRDGQRGRGDQRWGDGRGHDHGGRDRGRYYGWERQRDRGHHYGWQRGRHGSPYRYVHRHGAGCGHRGYAYRPAYYGPRHAQPFWFYGR